MLMQLGFKGALFLSAMTLPSHFDADIFLIHPRYQYSFGTLNFPRARLVQALAVDGVERVGYAMFETGDWRNQESTRMDQIFVIGISVDQPVFDQRPDRDAASPRHGALRRTLTPEVRAHERDTHDNRILDIADRIVSLEDGKLMSFTRSVIARNKDLMKALSLKTGQLMCADRVTIFLLDEAKNVLWSKVAEADKPIEIRIPASAGAAFDAGDEKRLAEFGGPLGVILESWMRLSGHRRTSGA